MRKINSTITIAAVLTFAGSALAYPIEPYFEDGPQDPLFLDGFWHELGNMPAFPQDEWIESWWTITDETSCWDGSDNPDVPNALVFIRNLTGISWQNLHYVADPETTITNFDGWIGQVGAGSEEAFKIDYRKAGINGPLVSEDMAADEVFEPGEIWGFIVQDYSNAFGLDPSMFGSLGIAGASAGDQLSTGSIIAQQVPAPSVLSLLAAGILAVRRRR